MKILFHHRTMSLDGQAVHIDELTSALRNLGHEIIVVGPESRCRRDIGQDNGQLPALRRHLPRVLHELLELSYSLVAYSRLKAAYRLYRPDVLYERGNLFLPAGVWLKRKYGLPMLLEVNAPMFRERSQIGGLALAGLARWSEEMTWHGVDYLLPVTHVLAQAIREVGIPEECIVVVPNAVNPERFAQVDDTAIAKERFGLSGRMVLGFVGFMREWHGLHRVIDLLAESEPATNLHLLVVGDGPVRPALERRARERGVFDQVTFTGAVRRDAVPSHISAFDVALQPNVTPYASPLKLFEYMALGRAIVAPNAPNIREVLIHNETAVLFDPDGPGDFAEAIASVCADAPLRERIGAAARKAILEQGLTWEHNARRVEGLCKRLKQGQRPDGGSDQRSPPG